MSNTHRNILAFLIGFILMCLWGDYAKSQEHNHHPPQDQAIHERFYSTWMMPRDRSRSCCNQVDCAPAESRLVNGHWEARKVEDGAEAEFTPIPEPDVEHDRDSPDGRSHLCGSRIRGFGTITSSYNVLCFMPGAGT